MREFLTALILTLAGQTEVEGSKNKRCLRANVNLLKLFHKTKVFNDNSENYYGVNLKHSQWAIQF
jgi:hypothetical protein